MADESPDTSANDETGPPKHKLLVSARIGDPPYILDPDDLHGLPNPCPQKMGAKIRMLDENTIIKYGNSVRLAEADAMHLAATETCVVCPELKYAYVLDGVGYIAMSYEQGESLDAYWRRASESEQDKVIAQLKRYLEDMRRFKGDFIGGINYSFCKDGIFDWDHVEGLHEYGPFDDEAEFNEGIVLALKLRSPPFPQGKGPDPTSQGFNNCWWWDQMVRSLKNHEIVFTHGDLHQANILIRSDGTVVLLDWGLAGYWPDYWEMYRANFNGTFQPDFVRQLEKFIPPFYIEAHLMRQIFDRILG